MIKLATLVFALCVSVASYAQPNLIGQWKSDATLSMNFNNTYAKLDVKQASFRSKIL
jgi:hypothetical protein